VGVAVAGRVIGVGEGPRRPRRRGRSKRCARRQATWPTGRRARPNWWPSRPDSRDPRAMRVANGRLSARQGMPAGSPGPSSTWSCPAVPLPTGVAVRSPEVTAGDHDVAGPFAHPTR
jgi:hypothetical protein